MKKIPCTDLARKLDFVGVCTTERYIGYLIPAEEVGGFSNQHSLCFNFACHRFYCQLSPFKTWQERDVALRECLVSNMENKRDRG